MNIGDTVRFKRTHQHRGKFGTLMGKAGGCVQVRLETGGVFRTRLISLEPVTIVDQIAALTPEGVSVTKEEALTKIKESLEMLHGHIGGSWPLSEAFTDLDDHPEEDEHGGFNHEVGYVRGLCEAFGLDPVALCVMVEGEK